MTARECVVIMPLIRAVECWENWPMLPVYIILMWIMLNIDFVVLLALGRCLIIQKQNQKRLLRQGILKLRFYTKKLLRSLLVFLSITMEVWQIVSINVLSWI